MKDTRGVYNITSQRRNDNNFNKNIQFSFFTLFNIIYIIQWILKQMFFNKEMWLWFGWGKIRFSFFFFLFPFSFYSHQRNIQYTIHSLAFGMLIDSLFMYATLYCYPLLKWAKFNRIWMIKAVRLWGYMSSCFFYLTEIGLPGYKSS